MKPSVFVLLAIADLARIRGDAYIEAQARRRLIIRGFNPYTGRRC